MLLGQMNREHPYRKVPFLLKGAVAFVQNGRIHPAIRTNDVFCVPFGLFFSFLSLTGEVHHTVVPTAKLYFMQHATFLLSVYSDPFAQILLGKMRKKELTNKKGNTIPAHSHL